MPLVVEPPEQIGDEADRDGRSEEGAQHGADDAARRETIGRALLRPYQGQTGR